jgi:hypothetical protein
MVKIRINSNEQYLRPLLPGASASWVFNLTNKGSQVAYSAGMRREKTTQLLGLLSATGKPLTRLQDFPSPMLILATIITNNLN